MNFPIIFEDSAFLVIDKPVGISVTEDLEGEHTVKEWVKNRYGYVEHAGGLEDEFEQRYGIVHRLDKETSGVLLIAKNKEVFQYLKGLFKFRRIVKEYQVLAYGLTEDKSFEVVAPISRNKGTGVSYTVSSDGRASTTEFHLIKTVTEQNVSMSYLKALPKTGRTHQIRVHLKAVGHPVVNDRKYATKALLQLTEGLYNRMMLHAKKVSFIDWEGKMRVFESSYNLSDSFQS